MSNKMKVWTKQHKNILLDLKEYGRYIVKKEYIINKMEEHSNIYLDTYNWLYNKCKNFCVIPSDCIYPIWVSVTDESKIENSEGNVLLEIDIDKEKVMILDLDKWGKIVNYLYIPKNEKDEEEHEKLLKSYNIDDCTAYMKPFYPNIKSKIIKSWDRLFDNNIILSQNQVGIIWELDKKWISKITK